MVETSSADGMWRPVDLAGAMSLLGGCAVRRSGGRCTGTFAATFDGGPVMAVEGWVAASSPAAMRRYALAETYGLVRVLLRPDRIKG
jgi:hypothetical protein